MLNSVAFERLEAEGAMLALLGRVLCGQPDVATLAELASSGIFDDVPIGREEPEVRRGLALLARWASSWRALRVEGDESLVDQFLRETANEHFRLFEGPGSPRAPLWESVYFNDKRMVFQKQTMDVRRRYAQWGLRWENRNKEPEDNLGCELLFVAYLSELALRKEGAERVLRERNDFLEEHLLCWVDEWARMTEEASAASDPSQEYRMFYRGAALILQGAMHDIARTWSLKARHATILSRI